MHTIRVPQKHLGNQLYVNYKKKVLYIFLLFYFVPVNEVQV